MEFSATLAKRWLWCVGKGAKCKIEFKTNRYGTVKHSHVFYSGMARRFGAQKSIIKSPLQKITK